MQKLAPNLMVLRAPYGLNPALQNRYILPGARIKRATFFNFVLGFADFGYFFWRALVCQILQFS